jgi:two-component system, sensor histidine kinase RegB
MSGFSLDVPAASGGGRLPLPRAGFAPAAGAAIPNAPTHGDEDDGGLDIAARGMRGLRIAVCGLLLATLPFSERVLGFHVRYELAVPAMAAAVLANALLGRQGAPGGARPPRALALGLALDLLGIFAVLAGSGGAANPWSALFLVHVALAAAVLPRGTTLALSSFAACLFLALFAVPSGACCPSHPQHGEFSTHLYGMWIAFALSAGIIATFVTRVRSALEARGREIARLRREAANNARFRAVATLAAGTAHELNTPLGTIAVLAFELAETSANASRIACFTSAFRLGSSLVLHWRDNRRDAYVRLLPRAPRPRRLEGRA